MWPIKYPGIKEIRKIIRASHPDADINVNWVHKWRVPDYSSNRANQEYKAGLIIVSAPEFQTKTYCVWVNDWNHIYIRPWSQHA